MINSHEFKLSTWLDATSATAAASYYYYFSSSSYY